MALQKHLRLSALGPDGESDSRAPPATAPAARWRWGRVASAGGYLVNLFNGNCTPSSNCISSETFIHPIAGAKRNRRE
jgi:hypothetical protein